MVNTTKFDKEYFRLWFKNLSPEKRELRNHRIRHHNDNYIAHRKRNLKDKSNGKTS